MMTKGQQIFGWVVFIISALGFIVAAILNRDWPGLFGAVVFLFGCFVFLIPLLKQPG